MKEAARARAAVCLWGLVFVGGGCTSFASVRSAEVSPGLRLDGGLSISTPPGEAAAWFWTFDCAIECDHSIVSPDLSVTYGPASRLAGKGYELGAGMSGLYPYFQGYIQLSSGAHPFGLGVKLGVPAGWREDAIFARYDLHLGGTTRLLFSPSLFRHHGNSPNGQNPGRFTAFIQAVGLETERDLTPWLALVLGRAERESYGRSISGRTIFFVLGSSLRISP